MASNFRLLWDPGRDMMPVRAKPRLSKNDTTKREKMADGRVARVTEIIAASPKSFEDAIQVGFKRATKTLRGITGMRVQEFRVSVEDNEIKE